MLITVRRVSKRKSFKAITKLKKQIII
ncbi:hypothetical protein FOXB_01855 [Fusarium oxysporum f. sp. conglutinans Fo5176]|uniref:Uncharacterized protein n=1 Tax=Fusarium oxysporum (strain Fo5176) TaxID=660025 RepID=F9F630_FUSOF|nr:hypothetical protein FOXB_01855 [Fusarium oxysporum f. sp. conglutinans Fo5176]